MNFGYFASIRADAGRRPERDKPPGVFLQPSHRTDNHGDPGWRGADRSQQFRHQRPEISQAIGFTPRHDDSDRKRLQVLLECQVPIHRHETSKLCETSASNRPFGIPVHPWSRAVFTSWPRMSRASRRSTHSSRKTLNRPFQPGDPSPAPGMSRPARVSPTEIRRGSHRSILRICSSPIFCSPPGSGFSVT